MSKSSYAKIKSIRSDISKLQGFNEDYCARTSPSSVDKHGFGFNKDSRFASFSLKLTFDNWMGHYGSSSCSTIMSLSNTDMVEKALIRYLNKNVDNVLRGVAEEMESDYLNMKSELESDIEQMQKLLSEISSEKGE